MVVIVESYLQYHKKNAIDAALRENPPFAPKSFVRYVDDSHGRFKNLDSATVFQRILNQQDPVNKIHDGYQRYPKIPAVP